MSLFQTFTCNHCGYAIEVANDGHPYLRDAAGKKHYFYHPGESSVMEPLFKKETGLDRWGNREAFDAFVRERCGSERECLCLSCGQVSRRDSELKCSDITCEKCDRAALVECWELDGKSCPKCGDGVFSGEVTAIS